MPVFVSLCGLEMDGEEGVAPDQGDGIGMCTAIDNADCFLNYVDDKTGVEEDFEKVQQARAEETTMFVEH